MPGPLSCTPTLKRFFAGGLDVDPDLGQDAGLFAGVQGVVDRLLDGGQEGLAGVVEPQQVAVLGKELADGDVALAGGHALGRRPAPGSTASGRLVRSGLAVALCLGGGGRGSSDISGVSSN